jgi:hypothetical protein
MMSVNQSLLYHPFYKKIFKIKLRKHLQEKKLRYMFVAVAAIATNFQNRTMTLSFFVAPSAIACHTFFLSQQTLNT